MQVNNGRAGLVFNIQRYSIHDGPGIRTTVFLKGCPLRCFWCQNPESQRMLPEILSFRERCTGCGLCVAACPTGAVNLLQKASIIDRDKCIGCGKCAEVCPIEARKLVGRVMTQDEVMTEVLADKVFYKNSGGGVTLSGGEATAQHDFSLAILKSCKEHGLHTVLDTCGYVSWAKMKKLLEYVDLVLYDIKCIDAEKHRAATGLSNDNILDNAIKVSALKPIRIRVPLVPGFNDSEDEIKAIVRFVKSEIGSKEIDLLPYNKLGEVKFEQLNRSPTHLEGQSEEHIQYLKTIINSLS